MWETFSFRHPEYLPFGLFALLGIVLFILGIRRKGTILRLLSIKTPGMRRGMRSCCLSLALMLMTLSLLGPQVLTGYQDLQKRGMDIYILLDTSKSMLVTDVKPDRLSLAKKIIENLLGNLSGDRVGFIPFASDAYIQMPLTDDYGLAKMFLDVIDTDMISGGGTNLYAALALANASFERASNADRVILILSDGEEHDQRSQAALAQVADAQTRIYTLGIGTEKGGLIPIYGADGVVDYMRDETGSPATSRLQPETLNALAEGRGRYYPISDQRADITDLLSDLDALARDTQTLKGQRQYAPLYPYTLAPGILLFMLGWAWPDRRAVP